MMLMGIARLGEDAVVSVVLPTYDRPDLLADAINSVLEQTYDPIEIVVVDDASPTPAAETVESVVPDGVAVRCIRHARNRGANAARRSGIEAATGEVIAFLDDDDRWLPEKIAVQVNALRTGEEPPGVALVGQRILGPDGRTRAVKRPRLNGEVVPGLLTGETAGPFSVLAVRMAAIERAGLPDLSFPSLQDREWLLRLATEVPFRSDPAVHVERRMGDHDQIGDRFVEKRDVTYEAFLSKHRTTAAAYGLERPFERWLAERVAGSALRAGAYRDAMRFGLRAIRAQPTCWKPYCYLGLAIGGDFTYQPVVRTKRRVATIRDT